MKVLFRRKTTTRLIIVGSVVLISIFYLTYKNTRNLIAAATSIEQTEEVLLTSDRLAMAVKSIQADGRVYMITRDPSFLKLVAARENLSEGAIDELRLLVRDSAQLARVNFLGVLLKKHTPEKSLLSGDPSARLLANEHTMKLFRESKNYEDAFLKAVDSFQVEQRHLLDFRKKANSDRVVAYEWFIGGLIFTFIILSALILGGVRRSEQLQEKIEAHNLNLEKSLKEVNDYKQALDESAIVAITDQRGIIKHVNDNFCRISKYSREELIGKDHRIINSAFHSKEFIRNIWQTISSGQVWKGELRNRAKDGSIYWVDTSIVPFINEAGRPYQYLAIRSDITERKKADEIKASNLRLEVEIQEKNGELADILERMTDGFIVIDHEFRFQYANKKFGEITHRDPKEFIGKHMWTEFPDAVATESYRAITVAAREQRYVTNIDYVPSPEFWYENHIYPTPKGLSILIRDITAETRAEHKLLESIRLYKAIASNIPGSVICLIDRDYRYFLIEGDLLERAGYKKEVLLGNKAADVLPKETFKDAGPLFKRVFDGETINVETHRVGLDVLSKYVPLKDENNEIYAAMIVSIDVTEQKNAERKVSELNATLEKKIAERTAQLETANKELESFSYSVAHDLRAPLRGVSGYSTMLSEDYSNKLDDEGRRLLSEIEYNARKMGMLIDDLLTFSRLGRKEVRKSEVDMHALFDEVLRELSKGSAVITLIAMKPVFADHALVKHVVINLLSNAVKYSSRCEQPTITVSSSKEKDMIAYSVTDNGVGFDMEYADKLFGVFQRLHSQDEFEGTGVGLAIVKRIVNRHGGTVWAEAKVDEGATFHFTLPAIPKIIKENSNEH